MRILIFSDIHGSVPVTDRMLDLEASLRPDLLLILGDVLYHGPRNALPRGYDPKTAAANLGRLNSRILAIRGNCDSEVDLSVLPFSPVCCAWLADGPLRIFATHGHVYNAHNPPLLQEGDVLLYGHTHVPLARREGSGVFSCNPGSLALPKEGHPPCYGLFDQGMFTVYTDEDEIYLRLDCN